MPDLSRNEAIRLLRGGQQGIAEWNRLRGVVPERGGLTPSVIPEVDLSNADLSKSDLRGAFLIRTFLTEAKLHDCDLRGVSFGGAFLNGANFSGAATNLTGASLSSCSMVETNFAGANLCKAHLNQSICIRTNFAGARLQGVILHGTVLAQVTFQDAMLDGASVYGSGVWDVNLNGASQKDIIISLPDQALVTVDNLEIAQFISLLLRNGRIKGVIDSITSKAVLILGRFSEERKPVLDGIRDALRLKNYCPVLFDFEKPATRDTEETIRLLANMAKFIIADLTDPRSIPHELAAIVPSLGSVPIQPILQAGEESWGMFDAITRYPWVLPLVEYKSRESLLSDLDERVIRPSEEMVAKLRRVVA